MPPPPKKPNPASPAFNHTLLLPESRWKFDKEDLALQPTDGNSHDLFSKNKLEDCDSLLCGGVVDGLARGVSFLFWRLLHWGIAL